MKYKEDRRHCKAKLKKAEEKLAKDAARLQVRLAIGIPLAHLVKPKCWQHVVPMPWCAHNPASMVSIHCIGCV